MKHTSAPWTYYDDSGEFKQFTVSTPRNEVYDGGHMIAELHEMDGVDIEANARLIAAAPELLEALKNSNIEILVTLESGIGISSINREMLRARLEANSNVIAKAEGE